MARPRRASTRFNGPPLVSLGADGDGRRLFRFGQREPRLVVCLRPVRLRGARPRIKKERMRRSSRSAPSTSRAAAREKPSYEAFLVDLALAVPI
jgi:hypothetical protein